MEFTGVIKKVLPLNQGVSQKTGQPWMNQEFVIEDTSDRRPQSIVVKVMGQDKLTAYNLREGDQVTVHVDAEAREYNGRYYNGFSVWALERGGVQIRVTPNQAAYANQAPQQPYGAQTYQQPTQPAAMPQQPAYGAQPAYQQPAQPAQPAAAPGWTPAPPTTAGQSASAPDFQGQFHQ